MKRNIQFIVLVLAALCLNTDASRLQRFFNIHECGTKEKEDNKNYFGPTKASVSLIYVIK